MIIFWVALLVLTLGAIALVVVPLARTDARDIGSAERDRRLAVLRDRRREIEADRDAGRLAADDAAAGIDALAGELATLMNTTGPQAGAPARRGSPVTRWLTIAAVHLERAFGLCAHRR